MPVDIVSRVNARYMQAKNVSKNWHSRIKRWRSLYDFNHYKREAKPNEPQYEDPTYTNSVDLAVGILLSNEMDWHAYGWSPDLTAEDDTSRIEKYLAGTIAVNSFRNDYSIPYEVILNFVRDGCAVLYSPWDAVLAEKYESYIQEETEEGPVTRRIFTETPVRVQVIDPLKVHPMPGGPEGRWMYVCRVERLSIYDVESRYGVRIRKHAAKSFTDKMTVKRDLIDYWEFAEVQTALTDQDGNEVYNNVLGQPETESRLVVRNAVVYEGEELLPLRVMEGYEDLPYTIQFFKPVDRGKPEDWGHSILRPLETSVNFLEKSINRRARQLDVYSSLPAMFKGIPGRNIQVDPGMGNVIRIDTTEDFGFPTWPGNPPDVDRQIEFLRSRIQQSGFSDVMFGTGASQVSGYALSQLGDQNRIRLEQPILHLEMLWTLWGKKVLKLTRNFAADAAVRVYGRRRGEDFAEQIYGADVADYMVKAQIKPEFPNEKVRSHAMATQVRGMLSDTTIMEKYLGIEQPDEEFDRKIQEMLIQHPAAINLVFMRKLREWGRSGDEDAEMLANALAQQLMSGQLPGGGGPNPEQLTGTQSPTGQPTRQAQGGAPVGQSPVDEFASMMGTAPGLKGEIG